MSGEFSVCKLLAFTYTGPIEVMHTLIITKPVASSSKLGDGAQNETTTKGNILTKYSSGGRTDDYCDRCGGSDGRSLS